MYEMYIEHGYYVIYRECGPNLYVVCVSTIESICHNTFDFISTFEMATSVPTVRRKQTVKARETSCEFHSATYIQPSHTSANILIIHESMNILILFSVCYILFRSFFLADG